MKNKEKFAKEIIEIAVRGKSLALNEDYKPVPCSDLMCCSCRFYKGLACEDKRRKWAEEEYVEPPVDWSKVPIDTPILVKGCGSDKWYRKYFAKFKDGIVFAWNNGTTSWSSADITNVSGWEYAKLAETEDSE